VPIGGRIYYPKKTAHNENGQYIALKGTISNYTRRDVALEKLLEVSLTFKDVALSNTRHIF
jgi:hypothetical protein